MKRNLLLVCFFFLSAGTQQETVFKQLHQLSGTWKMNNGSKSIYESWMIKNENEMFGRSYKINAADTLDLENVVLAGKKDGIFYMPVVNNQNQGQRVSFRLIRSANKQFVFENSTHDFPQRVIYHLLTKDSLHAWIEGRRKGKNAREDYYFRRIQ